MKPKVKCSLLRVTTLIDFTYFTYFLPFIPVYVKLVFAQFQAALTRYRSVTTRFHSAIPFTLHKCSQNIYVSNLFTLKQYSLVHSLLFYVNYRKNQCFSKGRRSDVCHNTNGTIINTG